MNSDEARRLGCRAARATPRSGAARAALREAARERPAPAERQRAPQPDPRAREHDQRRARRASAARAGPCAPRTACSLRRSSGEASAIASTASRGVEGYVADALGARRARAGVTVRLAPSQ